MPEFLNGIGVKKAFGGDADFSGMDGTTNLYLAKVLQRVDVRVDEEGTEAVAATIGAAKSKSLSAYVVVDHPFAFLIRDRGAGSILFMGQVTNPLSEN